jgi:hypothetical protein
MTSWTADELASIDNADELQIASRRPDGSLRPFVTIWVVRAGDTVYVRSAYGHSNPWFQRALAARAGRIRVAGIERDVTFEEPGPDVDNAVDAAYHVKYDRYGRAMVGTVVSSEAARPTLRLSPMGPGSADME